MFALSLGLGRFFYGIPLLTRNEQGRKVHPASMKIVTVILIALLLSLQYPLWLGKGGWVKVWDLHHQVDAQRLINLQTQARNGLLDVEVRDLKQGTDAIEERARSELGMIKSDEVFFQILDESANQATAKLAVSPPSLIAASTPVIFGVQR